MTVAQNDPQTVIAGLPMYDWPEIKVSTDRYWSFLREALVDRDIAAPASLDRTSDPYCLWRSKSLVLAQTCGLPLITKLSSEVCVLGAPTYRIEQGLGRYQSAIIVRESDPATTLAEFSGTRYAFNNRVSQSGYAAFHAAFIEKGRAPDKWNVALETGSHRASIIAVESGAADIAAVDAVSLELAKRHEPATCGVKVIAKTKPTPGLPYITSKANEELVDTLREVVGRVISTLPERVADDLLLEGFQPFDLADYNDIAIDWEMVTDADPRKPFSS